MRILLVDDEKDIVELLKAKLEKNNYEVLVAYDGKVGFAKARNENPDLIILDLMLPEMDGYWVCHLLKNDKRYHKIPVIILTAKAEEENIELAEKCGADEYIIKPFEFDKLLLKIEELI